MKAIMTTFTLYDKTYRKVATPWSTCAECAFGANLQLCVEAPECDSGCVFEEVPVGNERNEHNDFNEEQTQMKATLIKSNLPKFTGDARLYRVDPPLEGYTHVVVLATVVPFSGPETYIFGADQDEEDVADWGELAGSF